MTPTASLNAVEACGTLERPALT